MYELLVRWYLIDPPNIPNLSKSNCFEDMTHTSFSGCVTPRLGVERCGAAFFADATVADTILTSLRMSALSKAFDRSRAEIAGTLQMRQLATLESIGHKDGAREAMKRVLEDSLSVYNTSWALIQRARVLVTAFSMSWHNGRSERDASTVFNVDQMGREVLELLACKVGAVSISQCLLTCGGW